MENIHRQSGEASLEPPGSVPLVEKHLGRMGGSDQAAYLRKIHPLGLDSTSLKIAAATVPEQAIGFIAFSRLQVFFGACGAADINF